MVSGGLEVALPGGTHRQHATVIVAAVIWLVGGAPQSSRGPGARRNW
jgi:hypothetical protein